MKSFSFWVSSNLCDWFRKFVDSVWRNQKQPITSKRLKTKTANFWFRKMNNCCAEFFVRFLPIIQKNVFRIHSFIIIIQINFKVKILTLGFKIFIFLIVFKNQNFQYISLTENFWPRTITSFCWYRWADSKHTYFNNIWRSIF